MANTLSAGCAQVTVDAASRMLGTSALANLRAASDRTSLFGDDLDPLVIVEMVCLKPPSLCWCDMKKWRS